MAGSQVPLYERLPEIYRIRDKEQMPAGQLESYLAAVEKMFAAIRENIEAMYDNLFIETCDPWVIPYIGDLVGTTHLTGDPWTLRADVAGTVALRRRKGTLAAIEKLTHSLTKWAVHCVELRENLVWNQHLNHQRPDAGGKPPYAGGWVTRFTPIRGGTVTLRDPAMLALLNGPFDPFAHVADVKPAAFGNIRYNLPNLAIFIWRLKDYNIHISQPVFMGQRETAATAPREARFLARFDVHPLGRPVRLFNAYVSNDDDRVPVLTGIDGVPSPIPAASLTTGTEAGRPEKYVTVSTYRPQDGTDTIKKSDVGLQIHLPEASFAGDAWTFKGAGLRAWEDGVSPAILNREVVIDPDIGRIVLGVNTAAEAKQIEDHILVTYTYGAVGPVGAHPIERREPKVWNDKTLVHESVSYEDDPESLEKKLKAIMGSTEPVAITICDSRVHTLDIRKVVGDPPPAGDPDSLSLAAPIIIRAASGERPVIRLKRPLRFRPADPKNGEALNLRLEGLYITRYDTPGEPFPRAAVNRLEIVDCTLDPGGYVQLGDGGKPTLAPICTAIRLEDNYGFDPPGGKDREDFARDVTPEIVLRRSITGPLLIDTRYGLYLSDSIIDAGKGVMEDSGDAFALSGPRDPANDWGPPTEVAGITVFGRMRVESIHGGGGIWAHRLEVHNNQSGCIRFSYLSGQGDRLPQTMGCVWGSQTHLSFKNEVFEAPEYGQITARTDVEIKEDGPPRTKISDSVEKFMVNRDINYTVVFESGNVYKLGDQMGAFGFMLEAHKWRNLTIRFREFMPVGVRPILIPVT
jgi:hypothetical protein